MTPPELLTLWAELTGQTFRIVPYQVQREADAVCKAGFTEDEVRMVVAFIRKRLAREDAGYNGQSLLWRTNFADSALKFQERLSLAQEAQHRANGSKPPKPVPVVRNEPTGPVTRLDAPSLEPAKIIDVSAAFRGLADDIQRRAQG